MHPDTVISRAICALTLSLGALGCASARPAPPLPKPIGPSFEQKMAWILRLEDQRMLRDPAAPPAPSLPPAPRGKPPVAVPPPPAPPDLTQLLSDSEARVRRRAALAVGRVGLGEGVPALTALLTDPEPEVRQMAAFALGLIGDRAARGALEAALADRSPLVQGSAAEALGLIGEAGAGAAIGRMIAEIVQSGALVERAGDEDDARRDTPAAAFRLGVCALVRLNAYDPLAASVLDGVGQPRVRSWPVAYAFGRLADRRALPALLTLAKEAHPYTRAFAVKGLGTLKDGGAVPLLLPLLTSGDRAVRIEAMRALGSIGERRAIAPLLNIVQATSTEPHVRLEAITALGGLHAAGAPGLMDTLLDALSDRSPAIRAAALRATASLDPEQFVVVLSSLDADPHWSVRAALASALGTLPSEVALTRLTAMLDDPDQRVLPSVLAALVKLNPPNAVAVLLDRLKADDPAVRVAAADGVGELRPADGPPALLEAYRFGNRDAAYVARAAALAALARYGLEVAKAGLVAALADKDWAVRRRAVALLHEMDPSSDVEMQIRPAPTRLAAAVYEARRLVSPPVSTQVYIDTNRGTIQIDLAVLDAPLTVDSFVTLARNGFFDGLSIHRVVPDFVIQGGDPRGDGEGGPGYTLRDELSERSYLRGVVGMALDWADTGGSQFFITHSPQPHLDAKYTVFGRVVAGMEVVDALEQWDVIRRVRVWDGETMTGG